MPTPSRRLPSRLTLATLFSWLLILSLPAAIARSDSLSQHRPLSIAEDAVHIPYDDASLAAFEAATDLGRQAVPSTGLADPDFNPAVTLPIGQQSFKIEVGDDGIYEVTYGELVAAGMPPAGINPATFQLMNRGEAVAYQFQRGWGQPI